MKGDNAWSNDDGPAAIRRWASALKCAGLVVAGVALVACVAATVAAWSRQSSPTVTENDAIRILRSAQTPAEKEQALGEIAVRAFELCEVIAHEAKAGTKYADEHLASIADKLAELRK